MRPWASKRIASAAGRRGRPGMVITSPQTATTKPAPAESRTSRTGKVWPLGAPRRVGSALKLYCVLATHTPRLPKPASSKRLRRAATAGSGSGPVDLNAATVADLDALPGIGPVLAQRIVEHRERSGPFRSVEQLDDVPGIGPATYAELAELAELVTV